MGKFILFFLLSSIAVAKSININPLMTGLNSSYLGLEDASLCDQPFSSKRTPGRTFVSVTYHLDNSPWVLLTEDKKKKVETVVSSMNTMDIGFSWLLGDNMQLGFSTFGSLVTVAPQYGSDSATHLGDTRVQFKYRFLTDTYWNMAIAPEVTVPTGVEYVGHQYGASLSNSSFAPGARIIGEYRTNENQWTFNLGYNYYDQAEFKSPNQNYPRIDGRSRVFLGTGWLIQLSHRWSLDSEYSSQLPTGDNHFTPPGLLTIGARYQPGNSISWNFGAGSGTIGGPGGNDSVVYLGIKIPFVGKANNQNNDNRYSDPLLRDAYKKGLIDNANDYSKMNSKELEPYANTNVNANTNQNTRESIQSFSERDERTRRALFLDRQ